ncbi:MAG: hypothetical protein ABSE06_13415, partial [Anaerolineaceae bacterium]
MHLYREHPGPFAAVATTAGDVEGEVLGGQAAVAGSRLGGKHLPDGGKGIGVGSGVRARGTSDGGLVDGDDLIVELPTVDPFVRAGLDGRAVEALAGGPVEDIEHQRGLARAGDPGDGSECALWKKGGNILKIVLVRPADGQSFSVDLAAVSGDGDARSSGQVLPGNRRGRLGHYAGCALGHDLPAEPPPARSKVHHPVGGGNY